MMLIVVVKKKSSVSREMLSLRFVSHRRGFNVLVLMQTFCRECAWCAEVLAEEWRLWSCLAAWETMHAAVPSGKLMTNAQWLHNKDL